MIETFKEVFRTLADKSHHIAITSHMSPDDDSIGSVLLLYAVLTQWYPEKDIRIIYTGEAVQRYRVFAQFDKIEWVDDVSRHVEGIDMLVMLDASQYARFSKSPETLKTVPITVAIDHHASNPDTFTLLLHEKQFSSNAELVFRSLLEGGSYTKEVAEYTLLGILGDTGGFAFISPEQSNVFLLAKDLIEKVGTQIDEFRSRYMGIPIKIIPLLQELVKNTSYVSVERWPPMQYTYIDRATLVIGKYSDEDMSAASHIYLGQYLPRIEGYGWGFVVTPRTDGGCRQSARSLPSSVNVRDFHEKLAIGSGHDRASGGRIPESEPKKWIEHVLEWMHDNIPLIG